MHVIQVKFWNLPYLSGLALKSTNLSIIIPEPVAVWDFPDDGRGGVS
jgi:hypothetical protein